ncbi:MAG: methyltransferase domain-containing protein [Myxococcota bacterium]
MNRDKIAFFDELSQKRRSRNDVELLLSRLRGNLRDFGLTSGESVLDIGCGTGFLTLVILEKLSENGRVCAVDFSEKMIASAKEFVSDRRVEWLLADVHRLPLEDASFDRVLCFSAWPHFCEPEMAAEEIFRVLKQGGRLHIWHLISRKEVNDIHRKTSDSVKDDILLPAEELSELLEKIGFQIIEALDSDDRYILSAVKR